MNKAELAQTLCTTNGLSKVEASRIVNVFFEQMAAALKKGNRVEIRGLCSFYVKDYEGYTGRNPKTGKTVPVAAKKLPFFNCGKGLRDRVNKGFQNATSQMKIIWVYRMFRQPEKRIELSQKYYVGIRLNNRFLSMSAEELADVIKKTFKYKPALAPLKESEQTDKLRKRVNES